jgi:hypothetical protein
VRSVHCSDDATPNGGKNSQSDKGTAQHRVLRRAEGSERWAALAHDQGRTKIRATCLLLTSRLLYDDAGSCRPLLACLPCPRLRRPDDRSAIATVYGCGGARRHHGSPIRPSAREQPNGQSGVRSTSAMQVLLLREVKPRNGGGGGLQRDQVPVPPTATNWKALGSRIWNRTARPSHH